MTRVPAPPPRLKPILAREIAAQAKRVRMPGAQDEESDAEPGHAPASPLDWVAHRAGVKKQTVRKWMRQGAVIRRLGYTGPTAQQWIDFVDAVDALVAACSNYVSESIAVIARCGDKKALDALLALQKRLDRHEAELEAGDIDAEESKSVAHIPQELLDRLTEAELEALTHAQETMLAAVTTREAILDAAQDRALG